MKNCILAESTEGHTPPVYHLYQDLNQLGLIVLRGTCNLDTVGFIHTYTTFINQNTPLANASLGRNPR